MRAGRVAGGADGADLLAGADGVADGDADVGLVAVPDLGAVLEGLDGLVAVGAVVAGLGDRAVGDRDDRGAGGGGEVEAGVVAGPEAAGHAEAGGEVVAGGGQLPLVLGDLAGACLGGLAQRLELGVALGGLLLGGLLELRPRLASSRAWRSESRLIARSRGSLGEADGVGAGERRWTRRRPGWCSAVAGSGVDRHGAGAGSDQRDRRPRAWGWRESAREAQRPRGGGWRPASLRPSASRHRAGPTGRTCLLVALCPVVTHGCPCQWICEDSTRHD